jgi:DNA polymerase-1
VEAAHNRRAGGLIPPELPAPFPRQPLAERSGPGRKPRPRFEVHPDVLNSRSQNSQNSTDLSQPVAFQENTSKVGAFAELPGNGSSRSQNSISLGSASDGDPNCANADLNSGEFCEHKAFGPNILADQQVVAIELNSANSANAFGDHEKGQSAPPYILVANAADLGMVATALDNTPTVAVDIETTGLDPRADRIRLLSLATDTVDGGTVNFLIDWFAIDPAPFLSLLAEKELVFHNGLFDLGFLARRGFQPARVHDTMLMAKLLAAGTTGRVALADCCKRYLGREVDKTEQTSDWKGKLSEDQLAYAARDVQVLVPLFRVLSEQIAGTGLAKVADLESRCLLALVWMSHQGVAVNSKAWLALAAETVHQADEARNRLDGIAPQSPDSLPGTTAWNWDSPIDVRRAFALVGITVDSTRDDALAEVDHPLAEAVREYRALRKRTSSYGEAWLTHVIEGRVFAKWWQIGADSGRMSCSDPNLQNLPRDMRYRNCFAAPQGKRLVKADYSQIELRIAARVANDKTMIEAFRRGDDLHVLTARQILGNAEVSKADRQLAKALNFGLLYGMGAKALRAYSKANYGVELTLQQAQDYRSAFFRTYPGLAAWHRAVGRSGKQAIDCRTLVGRRKLGVTYFSEKLNMPVQGSGADGLKLALALLWERRDQCAGAFPVMAVHDEIVVECNSEQADAAAAWLKQAMIDAMTPLVTPVPVEVEVKIGQTWGG